MVDFVRKKLQEKVSQKLILEDLLDNILAADTSSGFGCDNMTSILVCFKEL